MSRVSTRFLVAAMAREEWRLHARLFGGGRFALFPAFLALLATGTAAFFALAGASETALLAGLHIVAALVGLQVGSIGLVGRDALENLLGDKTLLLYTALTLPVSQKRLLMVFVGKDVAYYAVLFVAPLVVGAVPLAVLGDLAWTALPLLLVTAWLSFTLGVGLSLALVGLATTSGAAALGAAAAVGAVVLLRGSLLASLSPYGLFVAPSAWALAGSLLLPLALAAVGLALFEVERETPARQASNRFRALHVGLGGLDRQGTLSKSLLDVARSSGGGWKVLVSQGLVFVVVAVLLSYLPGVVPVSPSPGLTLAAVLALGAFTTYNWLCQVEDAAFFGTIPVDLVTVFRSKLAAYLLLSVPAGLLYLTLGAWLFGPGTLALGAVIYVPLAVYVFGVTAYLAGLSPTELLFDTRVFAAFSLGTMAVLLPLVVMAIAYELAPVRIAASAVALSLVAAAVGVWLYRRAGPRWAERARR